MNIKKLKEIFKTKESSLDAKEQDYNTNRSVLRRQLIIRILSGVLGTILGILFIFTVFSTRSFEKVLQEKLLKRITSTRVLKIEEVKKYYSKLEKTMSELGRENYDWNIREEQWEEYRDLGVEEIAVIAGDYNVIYSSEEKDLLPIKKEIKPLIFKEPFYVNEIFIEDDLIYQHLYYKIFDGFGNVKYLYFKINNSYLNKILKTSEFQGDLLNDEFYIVASSRELESTEFVINDVTKKILEGRIGEEEFEGKFYSYSFIELEEISIYIQLYEEEVVYKAPLFRYKNKLYILWIISIFASFTTIVFIKIAIESYAQGVSRINIEREENKKYKFLQKDIKDIFDELSGVEEAIEKISSFSEKVEGLKEKIQNQNQNLLKKIETQEKVIEEINSDEEFKKKIKENIK